MEPLNEDASKLLNDLSEDELDSAFSRVVNPATPKVVESVAVAGERLHSLVARSSEVQRLAEEELARARAPVEWFLADAGRPSGPFALDEVRERWASGQIGPDTECWGEGLTGWTPICRVPGLAEALAPAPAAPVDLSPVPPQETVAAPSASAALKSLIEETGPSPVLPAPVPELAAPVVAAPPPPAPAPVIRQGVSHGRVALYVALSATIGAIAGGALVGLFAVQLLRFLPRTEVPEPQLPVVALPAPTPAPAPAPVAQLAPPPPPSAPVVAAPPAPEPSKEHKAEPRHDHPRVATAKKEKPAPADDAESADDASAADADAEVIETSAPPPAESASTPEVADAFDQAFGQAPEEKAPPSKSGKTVYVPPAPGKTPKAHLSQGDIMQVVVANKDQVVKCLDTARETQPGLSGKLLMRWTVTTSGETDSVEVLPGELAGSELAHCVTRAIQGWKFPQHSAEQAPITFPFVF